MPEAPRILKILPPIWLVCFFALALIAHFKFPELRVFDIPYERAGMAAGIAIVLLGQYFSLRASNIFAIEKTEILPASPSNRVLITRGPFQYSRNPMYLGMVLTLLGIAVYIGTLPMFVAALAQFLVLNFLFIPFEEKKLAHLFGESYASYKKSVRRWF